jgi:uncharacterized membrane-anchored protein YhcB (DUF1043 family)
MDLAQALMIAIGTLVGVIGLLFKELKAALARLEKEQDDCEQEKKELNDAFKAELKEHGKAYAQLAREHREAREELKTR